MHYKIEPSLLLAVWLWAFASHPALAQRSGDEPFGLVEVVEMALNQSPVIQRQREQVQLQQGRQLAAAGKFDVRFQAAVVGDRASNLFIEPGGTGRLGTVGSAPVNGASYRLGLAKQFRSGLVVRPYLEMQRTNNLSTGLPTGNQAQVGLNITYPLLEGRGAEAVAADERAAREGYQASRLALRATIAETAYQAAQAYWNYVAAQKLLEVARASEQRAAMLVEETTILVKNDERPAADLEQLQANLAGQTAARIQAEQALLEARQRLGLVMGLSTEEIVALALASGEFPRVKGRTLDRLPKTTSFVEVALGRRYELAAAQHRQRSTRILLTAARNELKPRLDLSLGAGYVGLERGSGLRPFLSPFGQDADGLNVSVTLSSDLSFRNRSARGLVAQRTAAYQQRLIAGRDLKRTISVNVETAFSALRSSIQQLAKSQKAVQLYRSVVENEKKKFRLGMSTLFDVILAEDRLTGALKGHVQSRLRHAEALVRLRFETGTLLMFKGGEIVVREKRFTTVPAGNVSQR